VPASDGNRAVFLSYASQDAEAAARICSTLRNAGIEVWFDQNELRGGVAWDFRNQETDQELRLVHPGHFREFARLASRDISGSNGNSQLIVPT